MQALIKHVSERSIKHKGEFRFVLKADNGETIATSETYTQKHNVTEVLEKYFPLFTIVDKTKK